jgi:hypothetical protein
VRRSEAQDEGNKSELLRRAFGSIYGQLLTVQDYSIFMIATNDESQEACVFAMFNKEEGKIEFWIILTQGEEGKGDNPQDR